MVAEQIFAAGNTLEASVCECNCERLLFGCKLLPASKVSYPQAFVTVTWYRLLTAEVASM